MNLLSLLSKLFAREDFICISCMKRLDKAYAYKCTDEIGVCHECLELFHRCAPASPYPGKDNINYIISAFEYTGNIRDMFLKYKFDSCRAYAPLFAMLMEDCLKSYDMWNDFDFIVPVPLHPKRFKERGYNQSELIASDISSIINVPLRTDILSRIKYAEKQSLVHGYKKLHNVKNAFSCTEHIDGKSIILFDDICTTGLTLRACAKVLHDAGAKNICALTFAIHEQKKLPIIEY